MTDRTIRPGRLAALALIFLPAIAQAQAPDLRHCNPIADDHCRVAAAWHARSYNQAHPHTLAAGSGTIVALPGRYNRPR